MGKGYRAFANVTPVAGAPTVDLYEDFQCPVCRQFEGAVGTTVTGLAQQGRIVLNYHVLNFLDDKLGVQFSTPAANGAFCAAAGGHFQDFHDAVYADQAPEGTTLDDATLQKWAAAAGINGDALTTWKQCVADGTYTRYVTSVNEAAFAIPGFAGTPTVVINGTTADLASVATPEGFTAAIQGATS
jgi:protein-disulfide isomerase